MFDDLDLNSDLQVSPTEDGVALEIFSYDKVKKRRKKRKFVVTITPADAYRLAQQLSIAAITCEEYASDA